MWWRRRRATRGHAAPEAAGGDAAPPTEIPPASAPLPDPRPNPLDDPEFTSGLRTVPSGSGTLPTWRASDLSGSAPDGSPVSIRFDAAERPVLLVFLSTRCDGCDLFWNGLGAGTPEGVDAIVVTKSAPGVPAEEVARLAAAIDAPVLMSDGAWSDFRVTSYPFLVLVEPHTRRIIGESVGFGWSDVQTLVGSLPRG